MDYKATTLLLILCIQLSIAFDNYPKKLVFELPDNQEFCIYELFSNSAIKEKFTINFRVIRGGNNDVDFVVKSPKGEKLYSRTKVHMEHRGFKFRSGAYSFCFGNEFSTVTHKLVFFMLDRERPETLREEVGGPEAKVPTALTLMGAKMEAIHEHLVKAEAAQTVYKAREADGRIVSEDLNQRVMVWSAILSLAILICGFGQVAALKTLFAEDKSSSMGEGSVAKFHIGKSTPL